MWNCHSTLWRKRGKAPYEAHCLTQCSNGCSLGSFLFPRQENHGQRREMWGKIFGKIRQKAQQDSSKRRKRTKNCGHNTREKPCRWEEKDWHDQADVQLITITQGRAGVFSRMFYFGNSNTITSTGRTRPRRNLGKLGPGSSACAAERGLVRRVRRWRTGGTGGRNCRMDWLRMEKKGKEFVMRVHRGNFPFGHRGPWPPWTLATVGFGHRGLWPPLTRYSLEAVWKKCAYVDAPPSGRYVVDVGPSRQGRRRFD